MNAVINQTQPFAAVLPVLPERTNGLAAHESWQQRLAAGFMLREAEEVFAYLNDHSPLVPLLWVARDKAHQYFPEHTPLALHLAEYPDDGSRELFLLIQTAQSPEAALSQLDRFDQEWWLDAQDRAAGKLNVKLEYL